MKGFLFGVILFVAFTFLMSTMHVTSKQIDFQYGKKFVIGLHGKHAGLFAVFFGALNNIAWCERNNKVPVVYWDNKSLYYTPGGYNNSTNVWEYYFEQTSSLSYLPGDSVEKSILSTGQYWDRSSL